VRRSGDGFITVADGTARWGRFGAAGVLLRHTNGDDVAFFLALRSLHCHRGGTWAIPGGAMDEGETPLEAALREFSEEVGPLTASYEIVQMHEDDHGGWSYWTVVLDVDHRFDPPPVHSWETDDARWISRDEVHQLDLFPEFHATLQKLGLL
jgi:8-oxo-dGTP pyrophosphatase MutT (NUDIX family)